MIQEDIQCGPGTGLWFPAITYGEEHLLKTVNVVREEYHVIVGKGVILPIVIPDIKSLGKNEVASCRAIHL